MLAGVKLATHRWRLLGPALFLVLYLTPTGALEGPAKTIAAVIVWMAVWWVSGAAPLAITSLLPLVLFPLLGVRPVREVAPNYADHMIFLFLGGFVLALAVERSGLHRRLAPGTRSSRTRRAAPTRSLAPGRLLL